MTSLRADFRKHFNFDLERYILLHSLLLFALLFASTPAACFRFADGVSSTQCRIADEQPPFLPCVTLEDWTRTDGILSAFWASDAGYAQSETGKEYTYGEVTPLGARQLASVMFSSEDLKDCCRHEEFFNDCRLHGHFNHSEAIVFYDLGSGTGRLTAQVFLENCFVRKAVGVELSATRHAAASASLFQLSSSLGEGSGGIHFVNADALVADISDATHIFISSLCFPAALSDDLASRILHEIATAAAPRIRVVAALTALKGLDRSGWESSDREIQVSWGTARVYFYLRSPRPSQCGDNAAPAAS